MKQALLVIDAQQELIDGNDKEKSVFNKATLLDNINSVVKKALVSDSLVVFIRDKDVAEGKGKGFEVHQDIDIPQEAKVFDKAATNAFYGTPLLVFLQDNKIDHLVIMGCKTEHCIDSAVRTATVSGFDVTLVEDGHSTTDSSHLTAEQIISHHNAILHGHYNVDNFSMVRRSDEDLFQPKHDDYR
ncbi:nicotinamidase-related amidase [Scopulibacillus darangshiensis]|uniref:Nicotinamidase-related amidase n=1 Tax=Scopulibacillus darangshiensis TaxID=442528 RepID=A0A4R2NHJ1_9BACL|nr:isochorismatase family protein [Scopulibacillus darangshiensis]TCP20780.1 nicotinamidase-related amidase [Scopulibacillus darangshiensis]